MKQSAESFIKSQAWGHQSILKEKTIPSVEDTIEIADAIDNPRDQALFVLAYLTAGRIREIIRKGTGENFKPSIIKREISLDEIKGKKILKIDMRNQKNRQRKRKTIPIPLDKPENKRFFEFLIPYLNSLEMNDELFPFSYSNAYRILKQFWNPHWFRHIRLTHLVTKYNFNEQQLKMYAGWTDGRPAKDYIEMRWQDLV